MGGFGGGRDSGASDTSNNTRTTTTRTTTKKAPTKKTTTRKSNAQETYRTTTYAKTQVSQKAKNKVKTDKDKDSSQKLTDYKVGKVPFLFPGSTILNSPIGMAGRQKAYETTRDYYRKNVVGKNDFKDTYDSFSSYQKGRLDNTITAGGDRQLSGTGGYVAPQGIEFAKAATGSATISGPEEIQKTAANTKGLTDATMSAAQTNVANKRKGRKSTNITAKKTLDNNYTLSKKTLLG